MTITTVALTDTFDVWRTRTNQLVTQSNYYETNLPTYVTLAGANTAVGAGANAFSAATIAGANTAVGAGANSYADSVGVASGTGANSYANVVWSRANSRMDLGGTQANSFTSATIAGANTAVGDGANNFTKATLNGANTDARFANNLTSGVVPFARLSGSYTSIIGVGTLTAGTWNATNIALNRGGTNASLTGVAGAVVYTTSGAMALTTQGLLGQVLTSSASSAPAWTSQGDLQVGYATVAGSAGSATTAGTVTTAAQPSITSVGTLTSLAVSGAITAGGDITAFSASDKRLKTNISQIQDSLHKVNSINGITFDWNEEGQKSRQSEEEIFGNRREAGVIAQEIEEVLPEVVVTRKDGYKAVRYEKLVPLLIEAIKELTAKVEMLESKVEK